MTAPPPRSSEPAADEVDGVDEEDATAAEVALAALVLALLLLWLLPRPRLIRRGLTAAQKAEARRRLTPAVTAYAQRVGSDFAAATGSPASYGPAAEAAATAASAAVDTATVWLGNALDRMAPAAESQTDEELHDAAQAAADRIGAGLASTVRGTTREGIAHALGALWATWRSRRDTAVRASHRHLDGLSIPQGGRFVTASGAFIRFPGDPEAPVSETAGCRCRLNYRFRPKQEDDYALV